MLEFVGQADRKSFERCKLSSGMSKKNGTKRFGAWHRTEVIEDNEDTDVKSGFGRVLGMTSVFGVSSAGYEFGHLKNPGTDGRGAGPMPPGSVEPLLTSGARRGGPR